MISKIITEISKYSDVNIRKYFATKNLDILHKIKLHTDDIYYNTGKSSGLNDFQYDLLKDTLEHRDPDYKVPIGIQIRNNQNG